MALQYIENSLGDEAWKDNNPIISGQKRFYTDDSRKVSYIEYKVSCDSTPDCGFIMMNVDGNDVSVPIASPSGNSPSEILSHGDEIEETLYYFGPFEMYSENPEDGTVQAIDPQMSIDLRDDSQAKRTNEEKRQLQEQKQVLKDQLKEAKKSAKEFKKSPEFKRQKQEIKDQILNVPKEEFGFKMLDFAFATYSSPGASNVFVPGMQTSWICGGATPCYKQFSTNYGSSTCPVGCTPTAMGIIYGYHDRNGFPNLIPGTAGLINNSTIDTMIRDLGSLMLSYCSSNGDEGLTNQNNITNGIQYAINKGYSNASSVLYSSFSIGASFNKIKEEVDAGRPIIINITNYNDDKGHSVVGFGYRNIGTAPIVRMNMGWGGADTYGTSTYTFTSNVDKNLNAIYYVSGDSSGYTHYPYSLVTVKIN
ncbi:C10 family peptidase [Candidatus Gracilibacteria bacterium]|nr:C10 family peptidase [Candidatus Gracilibacteria bacterium]